MNYLNLGQCPLKIRRFCMPIYLNCYLNSFVAFIKLNKKEMPRVTCPHHGCEHTETGGFFNQKNTFLAHFCSEHLDPTTQYWLLTKLIDDYNGRTKCPYCPVKNKCINYKGMLKHHIHKHTEGEWLEWLENKYVPKARAPPPPKSEDLKRLDEENQKYEAESLARSTYSVMPSAVKPPALKPTAGYVANLDEDPGYTSDSSNTSHVSRKDDPEKLAYFQRKNPILKNAKMMEKATEVLLKLFTEELRDSIFTPEVYFDEKVDATLGDYLKYLQDEKTVWDSLAYHSEGK